MKFSKPFAGVKNGDVYPTHFHAGDACPDELLVAAQSVGALNDVNPAPSEPVEAVKETLTPAPKKKGR